MKFREKYAVKIDLWDAIVGGLFIYFTVYLLTFAFGAALTILLGVMYPGTLPDIFQQIPTAMQPWLSGDTLPFILALTLAAATFTFLTVVLSEEHFFSKHERGTRDLIGVGLIWGAVFVSVETIMNTGIASLNMNLGTVTIPYGIRAFTSDLLFWPMVLYVVILPWFFHYSKMVKARGKSK